MSLQETLYELSARIKLDADEDPGIALLHSTDRRRYQVGSRIHDRANGGLSGKSRFERRDFFTGGSERRDCLAGVPDQDLAIIGRLHTTRMPLEQLHAEGAFDLAQQFGGLRLRKTHAGSGSHQAAFIIESHDECELTHLELQTYQLFEPA